MTNLLTNALKYSADDTPVEVSLAVAEGLAIVRVRDHGPGLPPEEQTRVWEPFHRVPGVEVRSGSDGSLGLGLQICKRIIELPAMQEWIAAARQEPAEIDELDAEF